MRWSSLIELTGDDDSATSTVAIIQMSLKEYAWPSHILTLLGLDYSPSDRPDCHKNSLRFTKIKFQKKK